MDPLFDLNLLRVLVTLDQTRSVTRAADALNMSQSGLSTALARLRKKFGDALFVRTQVGMEPTPRARQMIEAAQSVLGEIQQKILAPPVFDPTTTRTLFKLAMNDMGEIFFMPRLLRHFKVHAPNAAIRCETLSLEALPVAMAAGTIDLALGFFPNLTTQAFFRQHLFTQVFACMMRRGHPLAGSPLTEKSFAAAGHVIVTFADRNTSLLEHFLQGQGMERRVVMATPNILSLPTIVGESDLLATVPLSIGAHFAKLGGIELVRLPSKSPRLAIHQVWHRLYNNDPRSVWLRAQVAILFNEANDEWLDLETRLYGKRTSQRPVAMRRVPGKNEHR